MKKTGCRWFQNGTCTNDETVKRFKNAHGGALYRDYINHKDELVLDIFKVVRLIGIGSDDDDLYWQYNDGRKIFYSSCVGGFVPLKGKISRRDYKRLNDIFKMNDFLAEELDPKTLESMDRDMKNFKKGIVSDPIKFKK